MSMVMLARMYVFVHFLPCFMLRSTFLHVYHVYGYVLAFTCSHTLPCPHLNQHFYLLASSNLGFHMPICPYLCFHMLVCLDLCSIHFMPSSMCLCTPCHVCVPRPRLCLSCHLLLQSFCRFTFLFFILAYWLGPDLDPVVFVIVYIPWPISKGLDHPFACLCLLASMLYLRC